jgi:hypothetical protein
MAARDMRLGVACVTAIVSLAIGPACGDRGPQKQADKPASPASNAPSADTVPDKPAPAATGSTQPSGDPLALGIEMQGALHRAPGVSAAASCKIKQWHEPFTIVGLCTPPAAKDAKLIGPHLILVEMKQGKPEAVASAQLVLGETNCETMSGEPLSPDEAPTFDLDLAAYTLAPGNDAIGVRLSCHNEFPSGEGTETRLYLFERQGEKLRQIFDQRIAWTNEDRVAGSETSGRSVVIIQKEAHDGRADLVLRTTTSEGDLGSEPTLPKNQAPRAKSQRFAFSGEHYTPASEK